MSAVKADSSPAQEPGRGSDGKVRGKGKGKAPPVHYPFWFGGSASGMAACVTHPLDLVKVRLQMRTGDMPKSMTGTFTHILKSHGVRGLYSGLSASLLRQLTYSTTRFGVYEELKQRFSTRPAHGDPSGTGTGKPLSFGVLVVLASVAGFLGGVSGNAADVLNVRMQHDAALPPERRRNYRHALEGMVRMAREEGLASWFRGVFPNSLRASAMTASQLASYDMFKYALLEFTPMRDSLSTHFASSFLAGVVAATVTSPIDVIKTRVMGAATGTGDAGILTVLRGMYQAEGLSWMFKGWVPSFLRLGPHTICMFVFLEFHRKVYRNINGIQDQAQA